MVQIKNAAKEFFLSCTVIVGLLSALLAIELFPSETSPLTVIANPFSARSAIDIIAETQGRITAVGRWPWVAIAAGSEDPDIQRKLKDAGALLVIRSLASACLQNPAVQGRSER
jgi:hypothetical protein